MRLPAGSSAFSISVFDALSRQTAQYVGYYSGPISYAQAVSITGATIVEQVETAWDEASNNIQTTSRQRFHDATGTGPLTQPGGAQPQARVTYAAQYPDAISRQQAVADYGTNGDVPLIRSATMPARSDTTRVPFRVAPTLRGGHRWSPLAIGLTAPVTEPRGYGGCLDAPPSLAFRLPTYTRRRLRHTECAYYIDGPCHMLGRAQGAATVSGEASRGKRLQIFRAPLGSRTSAKSIVKLCPTRGALIVSRSSARPFVASSTASRMISRAFVKSGFAGFRLSALRDQTGPGGNDAHAHAEYPSAASQSKIGLPAPIFVTPSAALRNESISACDNECEMLSATRSIPRATLMTAQMSSVLYKWATNSPDVACQPAASQTWEISRYLASNILALTFNSKSPVLDNARRFATISIKCFVALPTLPSAMDNLKRPIS